MHTLSFTIITLITGSVSGTHTGSYLPLAHPTHPAIVPQVHSHPVSRTDPEYFCPDGYVLQGVSCEQVLTQSAQLVCAAGYELVGPDCVRRQAIMNICPPGYIKSSTGCHRVVNEPVLEYCPDGTVQAMAGACQRQVSVELVPQCAQGVLDGTFCSWQTQIQPIAYCPDGYVPSVKHSHLQLCEQVVTYDCTQGLRRQLTMLYENKHQHPITTHLDIQKTCTKTNALKMLYRCPPGSSPSHDGHHCVQVQQVAPNYVCPGSGDASNCFRYETVAIIVECPPGTDQRCSNQRCVCERIEPIEFMQTCPEAFSMVEGTTDCQQLAQPRVVCPAGYVLQGDLCVRTLTIPASCEFTVTYRCEGGCVINP